MVDDGGALCNAPVIILAFFGRRRFGPPIPCRGDRSPVRALVRRSLCALARGYSNLAPLHAFVLGGALPFSGTRNGRNHRAGTSWLLPRLRVVPRHLASAIKADPPIICWYVHQVYPIALTAFGPKDELEFLSGP